MEHSPLVRQGMRIASSAAMLRTTLLSAATLLAATSSAAGQSTPPATGDAGGDTAPAEAAGGNDVSDETDDAADDLSAPMSPGSDAGGVDGGPEPASEATDEPAQPALAEAANPDSCEGRAFPPEGHSNWEWILTEEGELFGGSVRRLRDGKVRIASDELGVVTVDWSDIAAYHSPNYATYVTLALAEHAGTASMEPGGPLVVETAAGPVEVARDQLLSVVIGEDELDHWRFATDVGFNFVDGTLDQASFSTATRLLREDGLTRLELSHDSSYGLTEGEETVNNQWGTAALQVFLSDRFFVSPISVNLGYDLFQNIRFRATPGAGLGYDILQGGPSWTVSVLGFYQFTRFDEVEAGRDRETQGGGPGLDTRFEWDTLGGGELTLVFSHRTRVVIDDNGTDHSNFRTSLGLGSDLTTHLHLSLTGTWDRVLVPEPLQDGTAPQADTWTLVVGLGVSLGG